ncbi:phosphoribosyltransferase family protein [Rathayibacter sp. YIM 133350]|uniref:phosphoribosyltransferase n=1 Tax=Rathayibacter sp. YIM 133350 TaxID=3131992 RepID=UPI00307F446D
MMDRFRDRADAGRLLAALVCEHPVQRPVVLGLPRGGVPVAAPIASALAAPLDVLIVRKLGVPSREEVAMGAIGENGARVLNDDVIASAHLSTQQLEATERRERTELERRVRLLRAGRPPLRLRGRTALIVDDGIATGATARAACRIARALDASRVVLATPVAAPDSLPLLTEADEVICLRTPPGFMAVGMEYLDFRQTSDDEVLALLRLAGAA